MVQLRSKKWWWLFLRLWIDVAVNNAFQLYRLRKLDARQSRMNALEFRQAIVDAYYNLYRNERPSTALPGPGQLVVNVLDVTKPTIGSLTDSNVAAPERDVRAHQSFTVNFVTLDYILIVSRRTTLSDM